MHIEMKSFILGTIIGGMIVIFRAAVSVAKDRVRMEKEEKA